MYDVKQYNFKTLEEYFRKIDFFIFRFLKKHVGKSFENVLEFVSKH